jgi:hypothetical protein
MHPQNPLESGISLSLPELFLTVSPFVFFAAEPFLTRQALTLLTQTTLLVFPAALFFQDTVLFVPVVGHGDDLLYRTGSVPYG